LSKPAASRRLVCAFCLVVMIAAASVVLYSGKRGRAASSAASSSSLSQTVTAGERSRIQSSYAALPLAFEQNQGQTDPQVKYMARGNGYTLFLTADDAVFSLHSRASGNRPSIAGQADSTAVVHMHLLGGNSLAKVEATIPVAGTTNYFLGSDRSKWRSGVARFARVSYQDVYPGVNMAFHGAERELEFDFVLAPGANPEPIGFQVSGNQGIRTDDYGNLILSSAAGNVLLHKPVAYQQQNGARQAVDARFVLKAHNRVNFELGNYDRSRELVIDPSVSYATYLGGVSTDDALGITFDTSGNAYVTGETQSANYPSATDNLNGSSSDAFVAKIAADGKTLGYYTYVGGSASDSGNGIAVDASGNAFVAGGTISSNFPASAGAFQTTLKGIENAFIFKLSSDGATLLYSTFLGGSVRDVAQGIALDSTGKNAYLVGSSTSPDFPTSTSPLQSFPGGTNNGFVTKLNPAGTGLSDLVFSTYLGLGGGSGDSAKAVAVDSSGNAYVTGAVSGNSFHATLGAFQFTCGTDGTCNGGLSDAYVTVIKPDGSDYVYSTFLGGSGSDFGFGIAVDSSKSAYVTGSTSSADFPRLSALQSTFGGGNTDAFVTKLKPDGSGLVYSTYLGGSGDDGAKGIAVDGVGNAYITGQTNSANFPKVTPTQTALAGGFDAFVSEINAAGSPLTFSTYLGGTSDENSGGNFGAIAVDSGGADIYVAGSTRSVDFPTQPTGVIQPGTGGGDDAFVAKFTQSPTGSTFSLAATALSPASVSPGGSATSTVTVASTNGFTGSVSLACSVSPSVTHGPTCSGSATPGAPGTLTVSTTAASALLQHPQTGNASRVFFAMFLPIGGMTLLSFGFAGPRRKKLFSWLFFCLALGALFLLPACGGGGGGGGGSSGTPAGTYTITVSGTASTGSQTGASPALTLTVN
jgi:hypothetical protein